MKHIFEPDPTPEQDKNRTLWLAIRQALLIILGAVETYLGIERTFPPRPPRNKS